MREDINYCVIFESSESESAHKRREGREGERCWVQILHRISQSELGWILRHVCLNLSSWPDSFAFFLECFSLIDGTLSSRIYLI